MRTRALFREKYPLLGLLSSTWGKKKSETEALPALRLGDAEALYIYGVSRGVFDGDLSSWLRADPKRRLIWIETDPDRINAFLDEPEAEKVVADPQMHIAWVQSDADLEVLAEMFPFEKIQAVAFPSRIGRKWSSMRMQLFRKTALAQSLLLDRKQSDMLFRNFLHNLPFLSRSFYANSLKGAFRGVPAIVCGAGPSLEAKALKDLSERALLLGGGSTIAALLSQGVRPHFGMAVDPNREELQRFQNVEAPPCPLLYSTRLCPGVLEKWGGPLGYMRSGIGGALELWIEEEMGLQEPLLGTELSEESMSVTTMCVAWAEFLGCQPILFNGTDMAYTDRKRYAPGVVAGKERPAKTAGDELVRKKNREGALVDTAVRWVMESAVISAFAEKHPDTRFINTTKGGIGFQGMEWMALENAPLLKEPRDLYKEVEAKIAAAPRLIPPDLKELKQSLERVIAHLRVLTGEKPGSRALAEVELEEELATSLLFYDAPKLFADKEAFLALALRYDLVFMEFISQRPNADA